MSTSNNTPITFQLHHRDDIHRVYLEKLDWEELTKLISCTYPSQYTLKYCDTENDLVTMVSQLDLQDAYDMSQEGVVHLYVIPNTISSTATATATATVSASISDSAPDTDMKSYDNDLSSELSHDEISTLLSECLSDPLMISAIPSFLSTFIDQLTVNLSHDNPLSISWTQSLQQHTTIRDHVILSVLLPRMQQALIRADNNNLASRIPTHVLPIIKGFLPMLPAFLPTLVPMFTKFMSGTSSTSSSATAADPQQHAQNNPFDAGANPFMNLLGPMLSGGMQQPPATGPSSAASTGTSTPTPAPFNPFSLLGPLLAGAGTYANANANANPVSTNSFSTNTNAASQPQANPLLGLLGPLLAANANANADTTANNPLAALFQQFAPQGNVDSSFTTTTTNNNTNNNNNDSTDYTEQLAILESMQVGTPEINLSLLQQCHGSVERVVQLLAME